MSVNNYSNFALKWSSPAIAASAGQVIAMPQHPAYAWVVEILTDSGTSPTIDIALQVSPDCTSTAGLTAAGAAATFWAVSRFAQVTTSDTRLYKVHNNGPISGQAAAVATIADTGGVLETNFVSTPFVRIYATIGGTNPAFATMKVWLQCVTNYWSDRS